MQHLEVSGAVRPLKWSLGVKCLIRLESYCVNNFVQLPTNAQLSHKLSHCYMFLHYRVIFRQLVINTLPSYTSMSNAVFCNTTCIKPI